jgi:hypothetical protein
MTEGRTIRQLAEEARALASRRLSAPRRVQFGFQELRRGWLRGARLKVCWVEHCLEPRSTRILSVGTHGRPQLEELASVPGMTFPPPALDLGALRLEVADVLRRLAQTSPFGDALGEVSLGVCVHEGTLAWRALQEVPAGFRTVFLDAADGRVLYEKIDRAAGP